ncbi:hypothetical protein BT69DRAFT_144574 [Atractiella rhizophila]|nr:hypothetical protein BT69DRAFT_144574 [Atractiella rhizophila]
MPHVLQLSIQGVLHSSPSALSCFGPLSPPHHSPHSGCCSQMDSDQFVPFFLFFETDMDYDRTFTSLLPLASFSRIHANYRQIAHTVIIPPTVCNFVMILLATFNSSVCQ